MKIEVVKCSGPEFWYRDKIGEEYKVIRAVEYPKNKGRGFEVKIDDGLEKYVDVNDAKIIFEPFWENQLPVKE